MIRKHDILVYGFKYKLLSIIQKSRDQKMSKSTSFFDWENSFRKNTHPISKVSSNKKTITPLGIPLKVYNDFLEKWRKENL